MQATLYRYFRQYVGTRVCQVRCRRQNHANSMRSRLSVHQDSAVADACWAARSQLERGQWRVPFHVFFFHTFLGRKRHRKRGAEKRDVIYAATLFDAAYRFQPHHFDKQKSHPSSDEPSGEGMCVRTPRATWRRVRRKSNIRWTA